MNTVAEQSATYYSLPIPHDFSQDTSDDATGLLKLFQRVKPLFAPTTDPSRPGSPPQQTTSSSSSRPPHSRQLSTASEKLGSIVTSSGFASGQTDSSQRPDGTTRTTAPFLPTSHSVASALSLPEVQGPARSAAMAPGVRPFKMSTSAAPTVRLSQTTSVRSDLSGRAIAHESPSTLRRTMTMSSDMSDNASPAYGQIPGFALSNDLVNDDTRSVSSFAGTVQSRDILENVRKLQREGKGLSKEFWLADDSAKYCYSCHSVFTVWRRKHHCRVCGQIFCAQCAQNMRPGAPYGWSGVVRVCDLCAAVYNQTKIESRRSRGTSFSRSESTAALVRSPTGLDRFPSLSGMTSSSVGRAASPLTISGPLEAQENATQSRFSASALFPRTEFHHHLASPVMETTDISPPSTPNAESDPAVSPDMQRELSSPFEIEDRRPNHDQSAPLATGKAPFRRDVVDDEHPVPTQPTSSEQGISTPYAQTNGSAKRELPIRTGLGLMGLDEPSTPEQGDLLALQKVPTNDSMDGTTALETVAAASPRLVRKYRSRAGSRGVDQLLDSIHDRPLTMQRHLSIKERYRRDSYFRSVNVTDDRASTAALPIASLEYILDLLRQGLAAEAIEGAMEWEIHLLPLILRMSRDPTPSIQSNDMDIRTLIRIKKVPGGHPRMSEFIDGVVFTKNVLHKKMSRLIQSPRVMLISFALEYARVEGQFMSLEPMIRQERDYLRNLVHRLLSHRPHIILCEKGIARLALEELHEKGIVVAHNIKPKVLAAVARSTQADVISSMDRLATSPRIGRCGSFRVQSFQHALIPGRRKTVLRFESCARECGATIMLRGGSYETLTKVKRVVDLLTIAIYNMRLEAAYLWEAHAILTTKAKTIALDKSVLRRNDQDDSAANASELDEAVHCLASYLEPYYDAKISTSCMVIYPPPYPLSKLFEDALVIRQLRTKQEEEEAVRILREEKGETISEGLLTSSLSRSSTMSSMTGVSSDHSKTPSFTFDRHGPRSSYGTGPLARTLSDTSLHAVAATSYVHAASVLQAPTTEGEIGDAEAAKAQHVRLYDVLRSRLHDDASVLEPLNHQHIVVLRSKVFPSQKRVCYEPELQQINFYGANDMPLGRYIEESIASIAGKCDARDCEDLNYLHFEAFVHGNRRIELHRERGDSTDTTDRIFVASYCPKCDKRTPSLAMSELAWQYSFGKFLELGFYADNLVCDVPEVGCSHDLRELQRYFLSRGFSIRCQTVNLKLFDVVVPALRLRVKVDTHLRLRDEELRYMSRANVAFWISVGHRLKSYSSVLPPEKLEAARESLTELLRKADTDKRSFEKSLHDARNSVDWPSADVLNMVRSTLNALTEAWDRKFRQFNETVALGRGSRVQARRVFSDTSTPASPEHPHMPSLQLPPPAEQDEHNQIIADDVGTSALPTNESQSAGEDASPVAPLTSENIAKHNVKAMTRGGGTEPPSSHGDADLAESDYASDSTVCARPVSASNHRKVSSEYEANSGFESDVGKRLKPPRRSRTTGTVEALVKRFDASPQRQEQRSSSRPQRAKAAEPLAHEKISTRPSARPSLRRGKSDAGRSSVRDQYGSVTQMFSDGESTELRSNRRRAIKANPGALAVPPALHIPARRDSMEASAITKPLVSRTSSSNTVKAVLHSPRPSRPGSPSKSRLPVLNRQAAPRLDDDPKTSAELEVDAGKTIPLKSKGRSISTIGARFALSRPPLSRKSSGPSASSKAAGNVYHTVRHFERLSGDGRRMSLRPKRARPMGISKPVLEVFSSVKDALKEDSDEDGADSGADDEYEADDAMASRVVEGDAGPIESHGHSDATHMDSSLATTHALMSPPVDPGAALPSEGHSIDIPATLHSPLPLQIEPSPLSRDYISGSEMSSSEAGQRSIWKNLSLSSVQSGFSALVANAVDELYPLEYPFISTEHLFENNPVVIREDEPSSIIAHTLRSRGYTEKLRARTESRAKGEIPELELTHLVTEHEGTDVEDIQRRAEGEHFGFQFLHENARFDCRVFYADRFDALRRNARCEDAFIDSMTRCVRWETTGGKSGSTFLKTRDDRFIIKELSQSERDAFVKFADNYFRHLSRAFSKNVPTILAKIFGMFRISFKGHGRTGRLDVLVMENVFYERKISKIYDLKGSMRNRKAPVTGQTQQVLLDENLVEMAPSDPIYLREQPKRLLAMALHNDTQFLAEQNVMDYSLVVGVDEGKQELVVGIIDFVRTYTWDKKLEHWIKNTNKREPTIVTPMQYKARFRQAMSQYFLLVPDAWTQSPSTKAPLPPGEPIRAGGPRYHKEKVVEREALVALPRADLPSACRPAALVS